MLSKADNEFLTHTGPGTPMGDLLRRFWMPALLSRGAARAATARRSRSDAGRGPARLSRHRRPRRPRRAALPAPRRRPVLTAATRSAACAASTTAGSSTSTATASTCRPRRRSLPTRTRSSCSPTRRANGATSSGSTWARRSTCPSCRSSSSAWCRRRAATSPRSGRTATGRRASRARSTPRTSPSCTPCRQGRGKARAALAKAAIADQSTPDDRIRWMHNDPRPKFTVHGHDAGLLIGAARNADGDDLYWRITQFLMPNHAYTPTAVPGRDLLRPVLGAGRRRVVLDLHLQLEPRPAVQQRRARSSTAASTCMPRSTTDYVPLRNPRNDYLIDREAQKHDSFTGIEGVSRAGRRDPGQPWARSRTAPASISARPTSAIVEFRKLLMSSARALQTGSEPKAAAAPAATPCAPAAPSPAPDKNLDAVMTDALRPHAWLCRQAIRSG